MCDIVGEINANNNFRQQKREAEQTTGGSTTSTIPADLLCFLCKNMYNEPLILSCSHSFCQSCVLPWLQRCTNCPLCRCLTLRPTGNLTLAEKVADYKRQGKPKTTSKNFIRSFVRRSVRTSKEALLMQKEAIRASQRRAKNVVLPQRSAASPPLPQSPSVRQMAASLESKLHLGGQPPAIPREREKGDSTSTSSFQRMGPLRKSFARIRNRLTGAGRGEVRANAAKSGQNCSTSLHSLTNQPRTNMTIRELMERNQRQNAVPPTITTPPTAAVGMNRRERRPSMGVSGSALNRHPPNNQQSNSGSSTHLLGQQHEQQQPRREGWAGGDGAAAKERGNGGGRKSSGGGAPNNGCSIA